MLMKYFHTAKKQAPFLIEVDFSELLRWEQTRRPVMMFVRK